MSALAGAGGEQPSGLHVADASVKTPARDLFMGTPTTGERRTRRPFALRMRR